MNLSGFDDCMRVASEIQSTSQGQVSGHLGNNVNAPIDADNHLAQFNAGLDAMETLGTSHIPLSGSHVLSESGSYEYDLDLIKDNIGDIDDWLKHKVMTKNDHKSVDSKQNDVLLGNKTEFLKEMMSLFDSMDNAQRSELLKSLSAYITSYDIETVRALVDKVTNSTE